MKRSIGQWLGKLLKRGKKEHSSRPRVRLDVETLENRTLLSLSVVSINGTTPASLITNATTVDYTVTFNEAAIGVNPTDFQAQVTGTVGTLLTQVTPVSSAQYTVAISGITGDGTLTLELVNNGTIHDSGGNPLSQGFVGQTYTIDTIAPFVQSINRTTPVGPITTANSVTYTVTFSEVVTGVDAADFPVLTTGSLHAALTQVAPAGNSSTYTVTISGISGDGTLELNLLTNNTIYDLAGNPLSQQNAAGQLPEPANIRHRQRTGIGGVGRFDWRRQNRPRRGQ